MAHNREDEIDSLQREICQVGDAIRQLQERHLALLRRLNSVQASTASLPTETLSLIFGFKCASLQGHLCICPSDPGDPPHVFPDRWGAYPALTLSHVSSHWRQVAWSAPQLWNRMGAEVSERNAGSVLSLLKLCLQNSKALPFDLDLHFLNGGADHFNEIEPTFFFNPRYSSKIRTLWLTNPHSRWLSNISTACPQLTCLSILDPYMTLRNEPALESASLLRHVRLRDVVVQVLGPFSSITHVELVMVPIDSCAKLLTRCPNLQYFLSDLPQSPGAEFTPPIHIAVLHHLQQLAWGCSQNPWCEATLQSIRLPALRMLLWSEVNSVTETQPCIHALFRHLPITLLHLELAWITHWNLPLFKYAFSQTPYVQELIMESCALECLYAVFCALCPGWEDDMTKYLPSLGSLVINGCTNSENFGIDFSRRILDICKAKNFGSDPQFALELAGIRMDWATGIQEELNEMVRGGFRLEIIEYNHT